MRINLLALVNLCREKLGLGRQWAISQKKKKKSKKISYRKNNDKYGAGKSSNGDVYIMQFFQPDAEWYILITVIVPLFFHVRRLTRFHFFDNDFLSARFPSITRPASTIKRIYATPAGAAMFARIAAANLTNKSKYFNWIFHSQTWGEKKNILKIILNKKVIE